MLRKTLLALAAALVLATGALAGSPPAGLSTKNVRLDVNFHDAQGLVFDATLWQIAPATPPGIRDYLNQRLDYSFEVDATEARCFSVHNGAAQSLACTELATLIDAAPDGGVDATLLVRAVESKDGEISFKAKKITVYSSDTPTDTSGEPTAPPVPPKFYSKSYRLNVALNDAAGSVFDASLGDFPSSTPNRVQEYISWNAEASFDVDASAAACFTVKRDTVSSVPCSEIAALVDSWIDPIYASVLAKPYLDSDGDLAFKAKKITVWL